MSDKGWQHAGSTRPLPAVRPTAATAAPAVQPFHTRNGETLWLSQAEIDNLRLREFATEDGEIAFLAACDVDGNGSAHYPPAHITEVLERLDAEAQIRTRCYASRKEAKDTKPRRRYDKDTNEWS